MLLAQISLQLSAFSITPTLVNSTVPALSLADVQSSFSLISYAVLVNTLWMLRLTLSLFSAFFVITVQQSPRQLRPPDFSVRRTVQPFGLNIVTADMDIAGDLIGQVRGCAIMCYDR